MGLALYILYIYMIQNKSYSVLVSVFLAALCSTLTSHTVTIIYIYIKRERKRMCAKCNTETGQIPEN